MKAGPQSEGLSIIATAWGSELSTCIGWVMLSGERNGRPVSVRVGSGETGSHSEVSVAAATAPEFSAKSRDGRVRPADGTPENLVAALKDVPNSTRWKKVTVEGGPDGIVVARKGGGQSDWLCDLWLAERLAECSAGRCRSPAAAPGGVDGPCIRLRSEVPGRVRRIWLEPGSPAAPAASA